MMLRLQELTACKITKKTFFLPICFIAVLFKVLCFFFFVLILYSLFPLHSWIRFRRCSRIKKQKRKKILFTFYISSIFRVDCFFDFRCRIFVLLRFFFRRKKLSRYHKRRSGYRFLNWDWTNFDCVYFQKHSNRCTRRELWSKVCDKRKVKTNDNTKCRFFA